MMNPNLLKAIVKGAVAVGGTVAGIMVGNASKKSLDSAKKDFTQYRSEVEVKK